MVFSDLFFLFVFIPAFVIVYLLAAAIDRTFAAGADRRQRGEKCGTRHLFSHFLRVGRTGLCISHVGKCGSQFCRGTDDR